MNQLKFITDVIYGLKREYGLPLDIYRKTSDTVNLETGQKTVTLSKISICRAVLLPIKLLRTFIYDQAYLKAARNITFGAFFDKANRNILVDANDLPSNYQISIDDYLVFKGNRYDIKDIAEFGNRNAFVIAVTQIKGGEVHQIYDLSIYQELNLVQGLINA